MKGEYCEYIDDVNKSNTEMISPIKPDTSTVNDTIISESYPPMTPAPDKSITLLQPEQKIQSYVLTLSELVDKLKGEVENVTHSPDGSFCNSPVVPRGRYQQQFVHSFKEQQKLHDELVGYKSALDEANNRIKGLSDTIIDMSDRLTKTKEKEKKASLHLQELINIYNELSNEIDGLAPPFKEISDCYNHTKIDLDNLDEDSKKIFKLENKYNDLRTEYNILNNNYEELTKRYHVQKSLFVNIKKNLECIY